MNKQLEMDLLNDPEKLSYMNNLLSKYQFSQEFLIKTVGYYDSWKCLRYQNNLSPEFCFNASQKIANKALETKIFLNSDNSLI